LLSWSSSGSRIEIRFPIYRRLPDSGRMLPEGLTYLDSWVEPNFDRCFQLMECDDLRLIQQWVLNWRGSA
jgi:hypothetical protein